MTANLTGAQRDSAAAFDAFGMGIAGAAVSSVSNMQNMTVQAFIDNVSYSGYQQPTAASATVSIAAPIAVPAEAGLDTGTFRVTRSNTIGDLVVYY